MKFEKTKKHIEFTPHKEVSNLNFITRNYECERQYFENNREFEVFKAYIRSCMYLESPREIIDKIIIEKEKILVITRQIEENKE